MSTNIYKKLNLTSSNLIQKQKTFPLLPCVKSPTHKIKNKDTQKEENVNSLEVGKNYQIMRTELKDKSEGKEKDLYLIIGSIDGLLFMNEGELREYFDLSILNGEVKYKLTDTPFYKTGMVIEDREYEKGEF